MTMSYYTSPFGNSATFVLRRTLGAELSRVRGELLGAATTLKTRPAGFPPGYPSYQVISVNGITDVIEHRRMEPVFYLSDDPAVWRELGVPANNRWSGP
jgi:hypothetical protein